MKPRTQFLVVVGLLILLFGITWFTFPKRNEGLAPILPATANRDCAPWDGAAFTVTIPYDSTTTIRISIWQSPDIKRPVTFSFPDETGQIGSAYILPELDPFIPLSGKISFRRVEPGMPVEGEFSFTAERGERFTGEFVAEWGDEIIMCG